VAIDRGRWLRASGHLDRVLDLPPQERNACLDSIRASNPETAADLEVMLEEHRRVVAEGFLESAPVRSPDAALTGVTIGAYTLVAPIGQGGMGSVWKATRSDGRFEGQVAVKLLNPALVGRTGEKRFTREGSILARLTHPNIARLTDAGVSNLGQPYLVLELIDGLHIDSYCDKNRLSVEERIRLFLDVQSAVAHAHANLIVHRDLKPSNVLVTGTGQVKLLDFGIAKLLEDDNHETPSIVTREIGVVLTPKYAAPEQVTGGPITTATDVYALGVLLFELVSGHHPAGAAPRRPSDYARAIVESEPARLSAAAKSARLSAEAAAVADNRSITPDRLYRSLRGDIETILAKAMKKEPAERYASVAEFADDLRRYLDQKPISARPDAVSYRAGKFVLRHRQALAASAVAAAFLMALIGFYTVRLAEERDRAQLQAAKAQQISELMTGVLTSADPYRDPDAREPTIQNLLDLAVTRIQNELTDQPELQVELLTVIGRTFERMGLLMKALPVETKALEIGRGTIGTDTVQVAATLNSLGVLQREIGNALIAEPLLRESLAIRRRLLGSVHKDVAVTLVEIARVLRDLGRNDESEAPIREALAIRRQVFGDQHRETATSKSQLGWLLWERGDLDGAEDMFRQNLATTMPLLGADHPNVVSANGAIATVLNARGDFAGAERLLRDNLARHRKIFGEHHLEYAITLNNLAIEVELQGRVKEAEAMYARAIAIGRAFLDPDHTDILNIIVNRARVHITLGRGEEAEPPLRHALEVRHSLFREGNWRIGQAQSLLAAALMARRRYDEAEPLMIAADRVLEPMPGGQGRERIANRARLVALYETLRRPTDADAFR
jgi:serine/threonine protein kinase